MFFHSDFQSAGRFTNVLLVTLLTMDLVHSTAFLEIDSCVHQSRSSSAVHEHCRLEGHSVDPNKTKVLSTEVNTFKRRIKEAIQIKLTKPALNRDNGYELAAIYDTILTPKRR